MKRKSRWISFILSAVLAAGLTAGCGAQKEDSSPAPAAQAAQEAAEPAAASEQASEKEESSETVSAEGGTAAAQAAPEETSAPAQAQEGAAPEEETLDAETAEQETGAETAAQDDPFTAVLGRGATKTVTPDPADLEETYDEAKAVPVELGAKISFPREASSLVKVRGTTVTLKAGNTYVLSGIMSDGQIRIDGNAGERIELVLNGAEIGGRESTLVYAPGKCKVVFRLTEGTYNSISGGPDYNPKAKEDEEEVNAAIYSGGDISICGKGELEISGNFNSALRSKGIVSLISGKCCFYVREDAIKANKAVLVKDGTYEFAAGDDGINVKDKQEGYIWIAGGKIDINARGKGLATYKNVVIKGGEVTVDAQDEAMEGETVDILGGTITLVSQEDAINASSADEDKKAAQTNSYLRFAGGETTITSAGEGDGIDSNGDFYMEGGTVLISGPESDEERVIDYNGQVTCAGGRMIAVGPWARMQDLGENPEQNYFIVYYEEARPAGSEAVLKDEAGNTVLSFVPARPYKAAVVTAEVLETGSRWTFVSGDKETQIMIGQGRTEIRDWEPAEVPEQSEEAAEQPAEVPEQPAEDPGEPVEEGQTPEELQVSEGEESATDSGDGQ